MSLISESSNLIMFRKSVAGSEASKWYVAYTFPKAERKVQSKLEKMGIESYLPMHKVIRNRSDRKKSLIVPLFPNYLFVHTSDALRRESFNIKEIVRYVSFDGKAATVDASIINSLKCILKGTLDVQIERNYKMGSMVMVTRGPFLGTRGKVVNCHGKTKLVIQIDALKSAVGVIISPADIDPAYNLHYNVV